MARRAGITRPIVYRHFDDLAELLDALVVRETARALAQLVAFMPSELGDDPREGLLTTLRAYLQAVESDPVLADPQRYSAERVLDHARWLLFSAPRQTGLGMP